MIKQYAIYLLRWQMSTPVLAVVLWVMSGWNHIIATIVANVIGGLIFFWVDRMIFSKKFIKGEMENGRNKDQVSQQEFEEDNESSEWRLDRSQIGGKR